MNAHKKEMGLCGWMSEPVEHISLAPEVQGKTCA